MLYLRTHHGHDDGCGRFCGLSCLNLTGLLSANWLLKIKQISVPSCPMYPSLDLPWYIAIPAPTWRSWLVFNFMIKKITSCATNTNQICCSMKPYGSLAIPLMFRIYLQCLLEVLLAFISVLAERSRCAAHLQMGTNEKATERLIKIHKIQRT